MAGNLIFIYLLLDLADLVDHRFVHHRSLFHSELAGGHLIVVAFDLAPSRIVLGALSPVSTLDPMLSAYLQQTTHSCLLLCQRLFSLPTLGVLC